MSLELSESEEARLDALCALNLLDTPAEERFDRITRLTARCFDAPIALVSLVDAQRQWFKSHYGLTLRETPRSLAFCAHAIATQGQLVIEDARLDTRFRDNPLVTGTPEIRFYAGQTLFSPDGHPLGTLCIIDTEPRQLTALQLEALKDLAALAEGEINKATVARGAIRRKEALRDSEMRFEATFEQAAVGIAHVGLDGRWLQVNRKLCEIVGYPQHELERLTFQAITYADDLSVDLNLINELLAGVRPNYSLEKRYIHKSGRLLWVHLTVSLVRTPEGQPDYFISVVEDIQAKVDAQHALERLNLELEARVRERTQDLEDRNRALALEVEQRVAAEAVLRASEERIRTIINGSLDAFIAIDSDGKITDWNRAAESTFGWSRQEALGRTLTSTVIPIKHQQAHDTGMRRFIASGQGSVIGRRIQMPARTKAGLEIPVEMAISASQIDGHFYFAAFLHDISERLEVAHKLEQKQQLLDGILETVEVGVVACSNDGEITLFNRAARVLYCLPQAPTSVKDWINSDQLLSPAGDPYPEAEDIPLLKALEGEIVSASEMQIAPTMGTRRSVVITGRALINDRGERLGAVVAINDVTALNESAKLLKINDQRLRSITDNLPVLIGQIDTEQRILFINRKAEVFLGHSQGSLRGKTLLDAYGEIAYQQAQSHVETALCGRKASFENEFILDHETMYVQSLYLPEFDAAGTVTGVYFLAFDITARKISELRQAETEKRLRMIADNLPVLIGYVDRELRYQFANRQYQQWLGASPTGMIGKSITEVFGTDFFEQRKAYILRCLAGETVRLEIETGAEHGARILESIYIPDFNGDTVAGFYILSTDITVNKSQEKQLHDLARIDSLTGLMNRRSFEERMQEAASRATRSGQPMALMFLDVDRFKNINDSYGHAGGDDVLKEFACRLKASVRVTDTVFRLAGDEFTAILEGVKTLEDVALVADKILEALSTPFDVRGQWVPITTSIGAVHVLPTRTTAMETITRSADEALYQAKAAGRNCYRCTTG